MRKKLDVWYREQAELVREKESGNTLVTLCDALGTWYYHTDGKTVTVENWKQGYCRVPKYEPSFAERVERAARKEKSA